MNKKNILELFGGCGGLGYGFHKEGFNIECCNELEQKIANTYIHNFPDSKVIVGDITENDIKKKYIFTF